MLCRQWKLYHVSAYSTYFSFMIFYVTCTLQVTANKPRSDANVFYLINLSICEINSIKHCFLTTGRWKGPRRHPAPLTCSRWSFTVPQVKRFPSSEEKSQAAFVLICVFLPGAHSQSEWLCAFKILRSLFPLWQVYRQSCCRSVFTLFIFPLWILGIEESLTHKWCIVLLLWVIWLPRDLMIGTVLGSYYSGSGPNVLS